MANTVQSSLDKIRESFRIIKTTAEKANVKFQEEGKLFIEARDSLSSANHLKKSIDSACSFFSDVAKKYSDESVIDNIITTPKTEQDKALRDYRMYQLSLYTKFDDITANVLENVPTSSMVSNNSDESAIVTVNDYVRLITSEPYKAYKASKEINSKLIANPPNKPDDYSMTREQKRKQLVNLHSKDSFAKDLTNLEEYKKKGYRRATTFDFLSPSDAYGVGLGVGGIICTILAVLAAIVLIVAVIIGKIPFDGLGIDAPKAVSIIITILVLAIGFAIYGAICYCAGMFLVGILFFIGCVVIDLLIALIWPISAIVVAIVNSKREKSHLSYYNEQKNKLQKEFDEKLSVVLEKDLFDWEKRKKDYDIAFQNYTNQRIRFESTKNDVANNYYKEVARVAATSKPILKSTYIDLLTIKENVKIIKDEHCNLYIMLKPKYDYEEAKQCYDMLVAGDVVTYDQAIAMVKNLKAGERIREERRIEQERREAEAARRRFEQERLERERAWEREQERRREERIREEKKEQERKEEERITRLENAIRDAERAQRDQTNALLTAALASVKQMNEQNELIEEQNRLLDKIDKGY